METIRLGLEWFLNPDHVPLLIAEEKGWLRDAGLSVEIVEPEEHLDATDAIEAGEMDVAITEPLHLVEDRAAGHAAIGVARFLHTNGGVMYFRESGIERPRDLAQAGTRLQYPGAPGPGGPAIVKTMIEADGGTLEEGALEPVSNGFYHTDALVQDMADAATLAFYNFEVVEARQLGHDAEFFALKDWGVPDFCQLILVTSPERLAERTDAFRKLVHVLRRGIDLVHQQPEEARRIYYARTDAEEGDALAEKLFAATLPCFTHDFSMSRAYYERLEAWLADAGLIEATPGADAYWTNEIAFS